MYLSLYCFFFLVKKKENKTKQKDLNRIAKIGQCLLCLREDSRCSVIFFNGIHQHFKSIVLVHMLLFTVFRFMGDNLSEIMMVYYIQIVCYDMSRWILFERGIGTIIVYGFGKYSLAVCTMPSCNCKI